MTGPKHKSYGRILKSSSLLAISSLINVLFGIIRVKVLAVQLGPAFFGTISLYYNFITTIGKLTSLGIGQSAVRDIAAAAQSGDNHAMARKVAVLHRIVWVTGIFGVISTLVLAVPGGFWVFGNFDHSRAIALLAIIVLITQIQSGQGAILSGLRRIGDMARMNIIGSILSTILAIGLLLLLGENGIVPFLIAVAAGQLIASWWYARKIVLPSVQVTWRESLIESREMVQLGISIVASGMAGTLSTLVILTIIRKLEGESAVGLYQSAFTISSIYVGFILQAMSGDYFPRLAGISGDRELRNQAINEQTEIGMLLAVPGLVAILTVSDVLIPILYSLRFDGASEILRWQVLGMLGRVISWPLGFILMARSDKLFLLISEWLTAVILVLLVWLGVKYFGPVGAGMGFAAGEDLWQLGSLILIAKLRHEFAMNKECRNIVLAGILIVLFEFGASFIPSPMWRHVIGAMILCIAIWWSIKGLVDRLGYEHFMDGMQKIIGLRFRRKLDSALSRWLG